MTPQQIVGFGVRLFAIWLALAGLPYVVSIPFALARQHLDHGINASHYIGTGYLVIAVLLWLFPIAVAHRLIPRTQFDNVLEVRPLEAARVGCFLLGLWLLIKSGPGLVSFVFRAFLVTRGDAIFRSLDLDQKLDLAILVIEVAISLFLITRSSTVASFAMRDKTTRDQ